MEMTKVCPKCGMEKPVSEFNKKSSSKDGYSCHCKDCHSAYYYKNNKKEKNKSSMVVNAPKVEQDSYDEIKKLGLDKIPPRLLIKTLRMYGYRGELELVTIQKVKI